MARQLSVQVMVDQKQVANVEYFSYFSNMITNNANVHLKLNAGLQWQNQH